MQKLGVSGLQNKHVPYLQVDPADVVMLVIAWHFGAATMCEFSRDEFTRGMRSLRCDSLEKLRRRLPELRRELQDERKFKVCCLDRHTAAPTHQFVLSNLPCCIDGAGSRRPHSAQSSV